MKLSASNNKINDSLKNNGSSSEDEISLYETEIEQISLEDVAALKDITKNSRPPLDPFFDETNTLSYSIQASVDKHPEVAETTVSKKRNVLYKYRYIILASISIVVILVVTAMYFNNQYKLVNKWDDLVYPGVTINGKSYAGLTKEDLITSLNEEFGNQMNTKTITIKGSKESNTISFASLDPAFNTEEIANEAFNFMKSKGFFSKVNQILGNNKESLSLTLKYDFNLEELKKFVEETAEVIKKDPEDASIKIEGNSIKITDESNGQDLKIEEVLDILKSRVEESSYDNIEVDAIVDDVVPNITRNILSRINGKLSSASMYKYQYNYNSDILLNIQKVSNKLNGVLVYPGEEFSFNNIVGDPSANLDFKLIEKIVNGKLIKDYFGISESSTVLYDALLRSGITITERCGAYEPVDYADFGFEAVVRHGAEDLKFFNMFDSPIYIESYVENEVLTISIYSDVAKLEGNTYIPVANEIANTNETKTIMYMDDPTLEYGKTEVIQTFLPKKEVIVFLQIIDQNGNISEDELYKQFYEGRPEKIRRGTKIPETINSTNSNNNTNTTSNTTNNKTNSVTDKN